MERLRLIQLDSVPVITRTQYLPAYSRLGGYEPNLIDDIAYKRDDWIEAFVHEACLHPVADEPLFRFLKDRARRGDTWKGLVRLAETEGAYIEQVRQEVAERGPMLASELTDARPRQGEWWGSRSIGTLALDYLFRVGEVGIRRVGNFEKQWDLVDRIVSPEIRALPAPSEDDAMRELLARAGIALGLGTADCLVDYFRLPKRQAKSLLGDVVDAGHLELCEVDGVSKPVYLDPNASVPRSIEGHAFVSPFDPIVWNRPRAQWLFDFEYKIEIYVPKDKRRFGYYVLPFWLNERLAGRADLKTDRSTGVLRLLAVYAEDFVSDDPVELDELASAMATELSTLASVVGVADVSVDCRGRLADQIKRRV